MKDLSYVIGRLQGLNELVKILKDLVAKKGDVETIAVVTDHISKQLDSILSELDTVDVKPKHKEAITALKEKHVEPEVEEPPEPVEPPAPEAKLEKQGKTVDDLLKELETMKAK